MRRRIARLSLALPVWISMVIALGGQSQTTPPAPPARPDLTKQPTLYVVGYAHLDTQWRWDYKQTIQEYLPKTLRDNFTEAKFFSLNSDEASGSFSDVCLQEMFP